MRTPQAVRCTGWCGSAEPDGHNAEELLARAVQARELDSADSIAQVLHHRIDRRVERGAEALARPEREEFLPRSYHRPDASTRRRGRAVRGAAC